MTNKDIFPSASYKLLCPEYDSLPESIKSVFSPKEYAFMPDELRRTLIHDMTNPEVAED